MCWFFLLLFLGKIPSCKIAGSRLAGCISVERSAEKDQHSPSTLPDTPYFPAAVRKKHCNKTSKLILFAKAPLSAFVSILFATSNFNSTARIPTQLESHNQNGTYPIRMTDGITEAVKKWTLDEMLEPSGGSPKKSKKDKAMDWGRPGHLTKEDLDVYVSNCS